MKERPILFSAPMVRAILDGTKTQTRRALKTQPVECTMNPPRFARRKVGDIFLCPDFFEPSTWVFVECTGRGSFHNMGSITFADKHCPYGKPGDRLWVRETHAPQADCWGAFQRRMDDDKTGPDPIIHYAADNGDAFVDKWRPSIHMPRWASRILLEIVSVRVERLQEISEADAVAEGMTRQLRNALGCAAEESVETFNARQARSTFGVLWDAINGPGSWAANPWVWVVEFKRVTP